MFTGEQVEQLKAPLDRSRVAERSQAGRTLSYVESWFVISEANRIFGFDGWSSETIETRQVAEFERKIGRPPNQKDGWSVSYVSKVRVTVGEVTREGVGSGHGIDADLGQAHESAIKEAESDARKRALMTFGNPFGLALYDKTQANVQDAPVDKVHAGHLVALRETARKADVAEATICQNMNINKLEELPVSDYQFVIDKLNITIAQKEKA